MADIDPTKVLVMGRGSVVGVADPNAPNAVNHTKIVHPHRVHTPAADRDLPPTVSHFSHDADFSRCLPGKAGEEGDPFQNQMWETNGLPVAGETAIFTGTATAGTMLHGWKWDVYSETPGLVIEIVVESFGGTHGGTLDEPACTVIGEFDASECGMGFISACDGLEPVNGKSSDVFVEQNYRVYLRIKAIDDPATIKCARFQVHQWSQCMNSQAPLIDVDKRAEAFRSHPSLGAQEKASPFKPAGG